MSALAKRFASWWEEMQPQIQYHYDALGTERWDGKGEGPGRHFGFEGFGLSISIFLGRMPPKRPGE